MASAAASVLSPHPAPSCPVPGLTSLTFHPDLAKMHVFIAGQPVGLPDDGNTLLMSHKVALSLISSAGPKIISS